MPFKAVRLPPGPMVRLAAEDRRVAGKDDQGIAADIQRAPDCPAARPG